MAFFKVLKPPFTDIDLTAIIPFREPFKEYFAMSRMNERQHSLPYPKFDLKILKNLRWRFYNFGLSSVGTKLSS